MEGLHPLSGKFRATADYAEAKRNFGGGWGTSRLGENRSAIPGSATVATSGISEARSVRSVGENVALQVPSHGIPIVAQGPKAIIRGLTTIHRVTTRTHSRKRLSEPMCGSSYHTNPAYTPRDWTGALGPWPRVASRMMSKLEDAPSGSLPPRAESAVLAPASGTRLTAPEPVRREGPDHSPARRRPGSQSQAFWGLSGRDLLHRVRQLVLPGPK